MTLLLSFPYFEQREGFDDDNYDDDHQERVEGEWRRAPRLGCSCRAERWRSRPAKQLSFSKYFRRSLKYVTNSSKSSRQMYQVNRTAWDRGLVSKAAMGDNLNKALWKLEIILENHHRQHAVPCSSSFIIIVDPISTISKKSISRWWPGPAESLPSPQQLLCSFFPSQLRPIKSELIEIQFVLNCWQIIIMTTKGSFQKRFSGFCPLRGGLPPLSAKLFWAQWLSVKGRVGYPPIPLRKKSAKKRLFLAKNR